MAYMLENNLIYNNQHGFMAGRSTTTNLLCDLNEWTQSLDNKHSVDVLYLDLAKAFDTVVLAKLLCKLKRMGIGGNLLKWLTSFLIGRTQQVKVKNTKTQPSLVLREFGAIPVQFIH